MTVALADLTALRAALEAEGLPSVYGGVHSNGATHMALVGLGDGSYVELISTVDPLGPPSPLWPDAIAGDGGACAWALRTSDLEAELGRVSRLGIPVRGPIPMHRQRPDGVELRWRLGFLGEGEPGGFLPFLIEDETPRELRVGPAFAAIPARGSGRRLVEVAQVVLAVRERDPGLALLETVFDLRKGAVHDWPALGARVMHFDDAPIALATPADRGGWLERRLDSFGTSPCAFVLRIAGDRQGREAESGAGEEPAWLDLPGWPWLRLALTAG